MIATRKLFTIEHHGGSLETEAGTLAVNPQAGHSAAGNPGLQQVLNKIEDLSNKLQPAQTIIDNLAEAYRREILEAVKLRDEMHAIQAAITETKRQVVSLSSGVAPTVTINDAAGELGVVAFDTESATNKILNAAEQIEILAGVIQSETTSEGKNGRAGEIATEIMAIYEACNFQDLTGQRIARVCETLEFVESRVARMAEIWGGMDALSALMASEIGALKEEQEALGTHALAAGPALVGSSNHVGQDDIDALFA